MEIVQESIDIIERRKASIQYHLDTEIPKVFAELERGMHTALETYSNVHRGTGHNSMISSALFERARDIVMEYLGLDKKKYLVVFYSVYDYCKRA